MKPVASKWYQIGLKLEVSGDQLHSVESDLRGSPTGEYERYLEQMLKIKLENGESVSWKQLALSLRGVAESELADKIAQDHSKI